MGEHVGGRVAVKSRVDIIVMMKIEPDSDCEQMSLVKIEPDSEHPGLVYHWMFVFHLLDVIAMCDRLGCLWQLC